MGLAHPGRMGGQTMCPPGDPAEPCHPGEPDPGHPRRDLVWIRSVWLGPSGGMGDVLSGIIAGLVAQGLSLQEAAEQGAYGHGFAADKAVEIDGERGLLASDLLPQLRQWVNR